MAKIKKNASAENVFGGAHTEKKLAALQRYLNAYTTALRNKFELWYIDAFAGSGSRRAIPEEVQLILDEDALGVRRVVAGSARIALGLEYPFHRYVFVEQDEDFAAELSRMRDESPLKSRIEIVRGDGLEFARQISKHQRWRDGSRAVMFLDPYSACIEWDTITAVGSSGGIDLWMLYDVATIQRLMPRDPNRRIKAWDDLLTAHFGTDLWPNEFYKRQDSSTQQSFLELGPSPEHKQATCLSVIRYYRQRMKADGFPWVAPGQLELRGRNGQILFYLILALANGDERAVKLADKFARSVLDYDS